MALELCSLSARRELNRSLLMVAVPWQSPREITAPLVKSYLPWCTFSNIFIVTCWDNRSWSELTTQHSLGFSSLNTLKVSLLGGWSSRRNLNSKQNIGQENNIAMLMLPHGYKHLLLTALKFRPWNILGLCHGPLKCCNRLRLQILHLVLFWLGWSKKSIDPPWQWLQEKTEQCVPCGLCGTARLEGINGLLYRWWEEASTGTWN